MSNASQIQAQCFLFLSRYGVVETYALDEATIATIAGIGNNNVVERTILGTATGKTNDDHIKTYLKISQAKGRGFYANSCR